MIVVKSVVGREDWLIWCRRTERERMDTCRKRGRGGRGFCAVKVDRASCEAVGVAVRARIRAIRHTLEVRAGIEPAFKDLQSRLHCHKPLKWLTIDSSLERAYENMY